MTEPIDAVITWVDGNDKHHAQKVADCFARMGIKHHVAAIPTRFNQCGEIDYCIKSILRFAPWIRTIYIVTDNQVPPIIQQFAGTPYESKFKLVDHRAIFHGLDHVLPTFNSLVIESVLWRIKGLSERFIYFNDDCSLIRPVVQDDFFREGKLVLRGHWKTQSDQKWRHCLKKLKCSLLNRTYSHVLDDDHRAVEENSAKFMGLTKRYFHLPHVPFSVNKKTCEDLFLKYPDIMSQNLQYPFRDRRQFWIISLIYHLAINQKDVVFYHKSAGITVNGSHHSLFKIRSRLVRADYKKSIKFFCMQSMDVTPEPIQALLFNWLAKRINAPTIG